MTEELMVGSIGSVSWWNRHSSLSRLDLRLVFDLIIRPPLTTKPIEEDLEQYAYEVGMNAIEHLGPAERKVKSNSSFNQEEILFFIHQFD